MRYSETRDNYNPTTLAREDEVLAAFALAAARRDAMIAKAQDEAAQEYQARVEAGERAFHGAILSIVAK